MPVKSWEGVFDASKVGPTCVQFSPFFNSIIGQEDCLVIDVYTKSLNKNELLPVMVSIHGGGFVFGSGNGETYIFGPKLLMDKDIVLVSLNYRLGAIGLLFYSVFIMVIK